MDNNEIGKQIRILRFKKSFTQQQLAEKIGVSWEMVSRYERGQSSPMHRIDAIAKALDTTPAELLQSDYIASSFKDRSDLLIPLFTQKPKNLDFSPHNTHNYYNAPEWVIKMDKSSFAIEPSIVNIHPIQIDSNGPIYISPTEAGNSSLVLVSSGQQLQIVSSDNIDKKSVFIGSVIAQEKRFV